MAVSRGAAEVDLSSCNFRISKLPHGLVTGLPTATGIQGKGLSQELSQASGLLFHTGSTPSSRTSCQSVAWIPDLLTRRIFGLSASQLQLACLIQPITGLGNNAQRPIARRKRDTELGVTHKLTTPNLAPQSIIFRGTPAWAVWGHQRSRLLKQRGWWTSEPASGSVPGHQLPTALPNHQRRSRRLLAPLLTMMASPQGELCSRGQGLIAAMPIM